MSQECPKCLKRLPNEEAFQLHQNFFCQALPTQQVPPKGALNKKTTRHQVDKNTIESSQIKDQILPPKQLPVLDHEPRKQTHVYVQLRDLFQFDNQQFKQHSDYLQKQKETQLQNQLDQLNDKRRHIQNLQLRQDQAIEKLLLEMQKKQWEHNREQQEKREVVAALADLQRQRNRQLDDKKRDQLAQMEIERLNNQERERDYVSSLYQRDLHQRQQEMQQQITSVQEQLHRQAHIQPDGFRVDLKEYEDRLKAVGHVTDARSVQYHSLLQKAEQMRKLDRGSDPVFQNMLNDFQKELQAKKSLFEQQRMSLPPPQTTPRISVLPMSPASIEVNNYQK